jgi:redox-sensing transcriptional repressor
LTGDGTLDSIGGIVKAVTSRGARRGTAAKSRGLAISDLTAQRLSVYLRCLDDLTRSGVSTVSSQRLAGRLHLNSAQIRKDLACFGEFGVRGVGYYVADLRGQLTRILGLDRCHRVAIIGAGNLGMALADYGGFNSEGFSIVALFDSDPAKVGRRTRRGVPVEPMETLAEIALRERISIAILAVPAAAAQRALDLVGQAGVRAVLSFAPAPLVPPAGVTLKGVDLAVQLENLAYHLSGGGAGI